ncbi:hypothetical protein O3M35_013311 [Rhynocoris fuscipes]|uniref:Uncharacterized protein n=1 Tax=Rhynocoris fuscipes TaxID=488301 RepID=A0AAW1CGI8_9HEMI
MKYRSTMPLRVPDLLFIIKCTMLHLSWIYTQEGVTFYCTTLAMMQPCHLRIITIVELHMK